MKRITLYLLLLTLMAACTKSGVKEEEPPQENETPVVREHGTPKGDIVRKTIGAAGGSLTSKDNTLQIEIPAGALAANTEISVQAVTNTLPGSPGDAYRLLPEGVKFAKPVKLTFKYTDRHLDSTDAEALFMAYQSQDGIWSFLPKTALNTTTQTLTVETTHFSDWAPYAMFWLQAGGGSVLVSKSTGVYIYSTKQNMKPGSGDGPVAIWRERVVDNESNIKNWKLSGAGTIGGSGRMIIYSAPSKVPNPSKVTVSVEIHNFLPGGVIPGRGATGKLILLTKIQVVDEVYFSGYLNGQQIYCIDQHHKYIPGYGINISGTLRDNIGFSVNILNVSQPILETQYQWFVPEAGGTATAVYGTFTAPVTVTGRTFWSKCDASQTVEEYKGSSGLLAILKVENLGGVEYVTGHLRGEFYPQITCGPGTRIPFDFNFRTKLAP